MWLLLSVAALLFLLVSADIAVAAVAARRRKGVLALAARDEREALRPLLDELRLMGYVPAALLFREEPHAKSDRWGTHVQYSLTELTNDSTVLSGRATRGRVSVAALLVHAITVSLRARPDLSHLTASQYAILLRQCELPPDRIVWLASDVVDFLIAVLRAVPDVWTTAPEGARRAAREPIEALAKMGAITDGQIRVRDAAALAFVLIQEREQEASEQRSLLRPAEAAPNGELLRPATSTKGGEGALLRASARGDESGTPGV